MPELPDVESFRLRVAPAALHQTIHDVVLSAPEMVHGISATELRRRLKGRAITDARRYGKHLLLEMDHGGDMLDLHFGMSGYPQYVGSEEPVPPYTRMALKLDRGHLAYVVPRKLGQIGLVRNLRDLVEEKGLGIDALDPELDFERFRALAAGKGIVKCWLMDQSQLAGIGNIYSDEILFQAGIHPQRRAGDLSERELRRLFDTLHAVIDTAVANDAAPERMPETWLLPRRHAGAPCPGCDGKIQRMDLCGRSAYLCPRCQH